MCLSLVVLYHVGNSGFYSDRACFLILKHNALAHIKYYCIGRLFVFAHLLFERIRYSLHQILINPKTYRLRVQGHRVILSLYLLHEQVIIPFSTHFIAYTLPKNSYILAQTLLLSFPSLHLLSVQV